MITEDLELTWDELLEFLHENEDRLKSFSGFDYINREWVEGDEVLRRESVFDLVVVRLFDRIVRISLINQREYRISVESLGRPGLWKRMGLHMSGEDLERLACIAEGSRKNSLTVEEIRLCALECGWADLASKIGGLRPQ